MSLIKVWICPITPSLFEQPLICCRLLSSPVGILAVEPISLQADSGSTYCIDLGTFHATYLNEVVSS